MNNISFFLRIKFHEEKNFGETLYSYDSYLNSLMIKTNTDCQQNLAVKSAQIGLLKSLQNNGLDSLLKGFISTNGSCNFACEGQDFDNQLTDVKFYNSWKLSAWDQESNGDGQTSSDLLDCTSYNKSFYLGLNYYLRHTFLLDLLSS